MEKEGDDDPKKKKNKLRIISLLPSITEVLSSLGVADQLVGITHECDYPPEALNSGAVVVTVSDIRPQQMTQAEIHSAVCGSLKQGHSLYGLNRQVLQSLQPIDFIFTQSLCDVCAVSYPVVLETCAKVLAEDDNKTKIISLEPKNLNDVLTTFLVAGRALDREDCAQQVVADLKRKFDFIRQVVVQNQQRHDPSSKQQQRPKVAFLEWLDPLFTGGHWIADLMERAGCNYTMCKSGDRSTPITDDTLIQMDPDYILIGPCGFSLDRAVQDTLQFANKKQWWKQLRAVRNGNVYALDGNSYYARPGPRLVQGCGILARCVHNGDDDEHDVGSALGEELAPSSGMQRITMDMYHSSLDDDDNNEK